MNAPYNISDIDNPVWHPNQKYTYCQYKDALDSVFRSLWFKSASTRFNLFGSYKVNLKTLVLYAIENDIDEIEYIKSIREILLKLPGCSRLRGC